MKDQLLSIIVPVLNEELILAAFYRELTACAAEWDIAYEVIAIDDGSTDRTKSMLFEIHERDQRWKVLSLSRNFGHQAALSAGLDHCKGNAVVIMDADMQDRPQDIPRLLEKWREGFSVVYAIRTSRREWWPKRLTYKLFYRILGKLSSIEIPLDAGDFGLMDRQVVDAIRRQPEHNKYLRGLRSWAGFRQIGIPSARGERVGGDSKYTLFRLIKLAADGVFSFSSAPLRLALVLAVAAGVLAIAVATAMVCLRISGLPLFGHRPAEVLGWTSLFCIQLFLFSLQMSVFGLMGEYLGRIFEEVKGRSNYLVAETRGLGKDSVVEELSVTTGYVKQGTGR